MTAEQFRDQSLHTAARVGISALERKHTYTKGHSDRVSDYVVRLVRCLDPKVSEVEVEHYRLGGLLHDLGKICVDAQTLNHTGGKLTVEMIRELEDHPIDGWQILRKSGVPIPGIIRDCILYHHESYDGEHDGDMRGYPFGLTGEEIPLPGRAVAIADTYDAMTTKRSYQEPMSIEKAVTRLKVLAGLEPDPEGKFNGVRLDPKLTKIFIEKVIPTLTVK